VSLFLAVKNNCHLQSQYSFAAATLVGRNQKSQRVAICKKKNVRQQQLLRAPQQQATQNTVK